MVKLADGGGELVMQTLVLLLDDGQLGVGFGQLFVLLVYCGLSLVQFLFQDVHLTLP